MHLALELFLYTVAAFGFVFIAGFSTVTLALRTWLAKRGLVGRTLVQLLECPVCLGFHVGWLYFVAGEPRFIDGDVLGVFTLSCYTAGACFILGRATGVVTLPFND